MNQQDQQNPAFILEVLDACCESFSFPVLDNGYVYLAATRLSLHRSVSGWALVIEIFGFSPRAGLPDLCVYTFANTLRNRDRAENYVTPEAHRMYLENNPRNEFRSFHPVEEGGWMDEDEPETVSPSGTIMLRGRPVELPAPEMYQAAGIEPEEERPAVFELCRWLAHGYRNDVLATEEERRVSVPPGLEEILVLEDWHHPDVAAGELCSETETFRQLAEVLATGDVSRSHHQRAAQHALAELA